MADHIHDEESIFLAALQKPTPAEQAAYLAGACAGRPDLQRRVVELLKSHVESQGPFDAPPPQVARTIDMPVEPSAALAPGTVIGPYKLLQQIGEGGMGTVYMAEQTHPVQRKVALKVIKAGMDSHQVIARFEAERQALAMMDHVNIARVLDAGATESGRPYFVMELVHGVPITRYCDDNQLPPRERLELFVPVCQAIQHAHQKGIIHRDIKPSNVMITLYDGKPVPKVIDFGVAKATEQKLTERTLFTQYGTMVGTLEYMSPEQAEMSALGVDTRTDIFSLGVLLYELLTGGTPLSRKRVREAAYAEVLRLIKEEEPPRPSTRLSDSGEALASISAQRHMEPAKLTKLVRGELDWIVMKTLEKDRNRRYETANGLAMDVQRYLHDETVQACPPSAGYRFRKFVRRYKGPVLATSFILLCLIGGIIGTTLGLVEAKHQKRIAVAEAVEKENARAAEVQQRRQAEGQRDRALKAEAQAEANFRQAHEAVDDMYTQVAEKWLAQQPHLEGVQREFLQKALRFYEQSAAEAGSDPATRFERARACRRVAEIQYRLGARAQAESAGLRGIELLEKLAEEFPAVPEYRRELADMLPKMVAVLSSFGRHPEGEKLIRRALALQEQLVADFPAVPDYRNDLGRSQSRLARILGSFRQTSESAKAYRLALAIQNPLVVEFPANPDYRYELAISCFGLGNTVGRGQPQQSQQLLGEAVTILEKLATDSPSVPEYRAALAGVYNSLAHVLPSNEAEQAVRKAIILQEKLAADFPGHTDYRYDLFRSLETQGTHWLRAERTTESELAFRRAVEIGEKLAAESPTVHYYRSRLAGCYRGLADVLRHAGNLSEAEAEYQRSIRLYEHLIAEFPDVPDMREQVVHSYQALAQLLVSTGRQQEAAQADERVLQIRENLAVNFPSTPRYRQQLARDQFERGQRMAQSGRRQDAEGAYQKSVEGYEKLAAEFPDGRDHRQELGRSHNWLGRLLAGSGRLPEAEQSHRRALELYENLTQSVEPMAGRPHRQELAWTYMNLANVFKIGQRLEEAQGANRQALALCEKLDADFPADETYQNWIAENCQSLALLLTVGGRPEEAEGMYLKLLQLKPDNAFAHNNLAWLLATSPDPKFRNAGRAVKLAQKAVELTPQEGSFWNTLGIAHYRAGEWQDGIDALKKSEELLNGETFACNAFFLAMAHWQLGEKDEARKWFDQAVEWMQKNTPQNEELRRFREEAAELLGVKDK